MYLLIAVEVSSLMRRRLPKRWWKGIHVASYAVYALGTIHLLTAGTDRHSAVLLWTVAIVTGAVACMTIYRVTAPTKSNPSARDTLRARQPIG
jgi:DMSO/TMAO reductase YedYZ heme-binding membrane subunit